MKPADIQFAPSELDAELGESYACACCGEPYFLDIAEIWPEERALLPKTCCAEPYEAVVEEMREWPREVWAEFLRQRAGIDARTVHTGFIPEKGDKTYRGSPRCGLRDGQWLLDFGLEIRGSRTCPSADADPARQVTQQDVLTFIATHHRHNKPPRGWKWGYACYNGATLVAVCVVGRPVSRVLDGQGTVLEITRLCVDPTLEPGLVWNACSQLYAQAARDAEAAGYQKIITYTLETESAGSVQVAGYVEDHRTDGGSWHCASRPRTDRAPTCPKIRWARSLRPKMQRTPQAEPVAV